MNTFKSVTRAIQILALGALVLTAASPSWASTGDEIDASSLIFNSLHGSGSFEGWKEFGYPSNPAPCDDPPAYYLEKAHSADLQSVYYYPGCLERNYTGRTSVYGGALRVIQEPDGSWDTVNERWRRSWSTWTNDWTGERQEVDYYYETFLEEPQYLVSQTQTEKIWYHAQPACPGYALGYGYGEASLTLSRRDTLENALSRGSSTAGHSNAAWIESQNDRSVSGQSSKFTGLFTGLECGVEYDIKLVVDRTPMENGCGVPEFGIALDGGSFVADGCQHEFDGEVPAKIKMKTALVRVYAVAQGEGEPSGTCCGGTGLPGTGEGNTCNSFHWHFNLGKDSNGESAGALWIRQDYINPGTFTPAALWYPESGSARVVREFDGSISQIHSAQALVDVHVVSGDKYELRFYRPGQGGWMYPGGFYDFLDDNLDPETPFVTWTVENISLGSTDAIRFTRTIGIKSVTHDISYDPALHEWTFEKAEGLVTTVRTNSVDSNGDRVRTTIIKDANDNVAAAYDEIYHDFGWEGDRRIKKIDYPGGVPGSGTGLVTEWDYYNLPSDGDDYGHLKSVEWPDGYWERYEYDSLGRRYKTVLPAGNSLISTTDDTAHQVRLVEIRVLDLDNDGVEDKEEIHTTLWQGNEVSRTIYVDWGQYESGCRKRSEVRVNLPGKKWEDLAALDNKDKLETIRWIHASGDFQGEPHKLIRPDGTIELYDYAWEIDQATEEILSLSTTILRGEANTANDDIVQGEKSIRVTFPNGDLDYEEEWAIYLDEQGVEQEIMIASTDVVLADEWGRPLDILKVLDGTITKRRYATCGCGLESETDAEGIQTMYGYDALGRVTSISRAGITTIFDLDAEGRRIKTTRVGTDSSEIVVEERDYDQAGRLTEIETPHGDAGVATTEYFMESAPSGLWRNRVVYADNGVKIVDKYRDRQAASQSGTAVPGKGYERDYDPTHGFYHRETSGQESITRYQDMLGRVHRIEYADGEFEERGYNDKGQLEWTKDADGVTQFFTYNGLGEVEDTATLISGTVQTGIQESGTDRIFRTVRDYLPAADNPHGDVDVLRVRTYIWPEDNNANKELTRTNYTTVAGIRDGRQTWTDEYGRISHIQVEFLGNGQREETITHPDQSYVVRLYQDGRLSETSEYTSSQSLLTSTTLEYDEHLRLEERTESGSGTTIYTYYDDDRVKTATTPDPSPSRSGSGWDPQTTTFVYDEMGRQKTVNYHGGDVLENRYYLTGDLRLQWGDRTTPVKYEYTDQGRLWKMTTWEEFNGSETNPGGTGPATTTWAYDPLRGWLDSKEDAEDRKTTYDYYGSGRLWTRTWERGVVTTYTYTDAGDPWTVTYSDGTPSVTHTYDRQGRIWKTDDAAGTLTRQYANGANIEHEAYTGSSVLNGIVIEHDYDEYGRLSGVATDAGYELDYRYDTGGRIERISEGFHQADLGYDPGKNHLKDVNILRLGVMRVRHERTIDGLGRISDVKTTIDGAVAVARDYDFNDANQRTIGELEDGRAWHYDYDDLGQVKFAHKRLSTSPSSALVPGSSFAYVFDDIGNRDTVTVNGQTAIYTANLLNQYENREVPAIIDVLGEAEPAATVTVDAQSTQRTGRDFYRQIPVDNTTNAVHVSIDVEADIASQDVDETRWAFLAEDPEVFDYDLDGNLLFDGRWDYEWDGENRLKAMETRNAIAAAFPELRQRLEFAYDFQGRRIQKIVKEWNPSLSEWETIVDLRFIYDGWNLIEERDALNGDTVVRKHVWGLDLSGTLEGAGGVGGLLWTTTDTQTFAASADGNGNIIAWINTASLAIAGRADYSPFGEPVVQTGVAKELPFGFSSKYEDLETDLLYYGYRYYSPSMGRWLNRDPIGERGGLNLYGMVGNDPVNRVDFLGLHTTIDRGNYPFNLQVPGLFRELLSTDGGVSGVVFWRKVCCNKENSKSWNVGKQKYIVTVDHVQVHGSGEISATQAVRRLLRRLPQRYRDALDDANVSLDAGVSLSGSGSARFHYDQCIESGNAAGSVSLTASPNVSATIGDPNLLHASIAGSVPINIGLTAGGGTNGIFNLSPTNVSANLEASGSLRDGSEELFGFGPFSTQLFNWQNQRGFGLRFDLSGWPPTIGLQ